MSEFSRRLKQKMDEKRLTQSALARRVRVTPTAVWNWENGHVMPREKSLQKLANALGVDPSWLRGGEEEVAEEAGIDSVADELDRLQERIAELNGVDIDRVTIRVEIV